MPLFKRKQLTSLLLCAALTACGGGSGANNSALPNSSSSTSALPNSPSSTSTAASDTAPSSGASSTTSAPQLASASQVIDGTPIGTPQWTEGATASGGNGQAVGGLDCTRTGGTYSYAHLSILVDGQQVAVPANIGVVSPPNPLYGCSYPVETNDQSGKIRTLNGPAGYTLGQFFAIWGQPLSATNVAGITGKPIAFYVNDGGTLTQYTGDPSSIALDANREISIQVGTAPAQIPTYSWVNPPPLAATSSELTATVGTTAMWPDGDNANGGQGQPVDGLTCEPMDETYHVHPHLTIIKDGTMLVLPQFIGITSICDYNVHVHDQSGVIHVETPAYNRRFTLGNFFDVWGQPLTATNVAGLTGEPIAVYVEDAGNVRRWMGDIRDIDLYSKRSITVQIGTPLSSIPSWDWVNAGYSH